MAEETKQEITYTLGDTIRIEFEVTDESGVGLITAQFNNPQEPSKNIQLHGNAEGQHRAVVILERLVTNDIAPGEYVCSYVDLRDMQGNQTVISRPDIRFRIEGVPGDHEGPELEHWRVLR